jgi:hypothetical protein
MDQNKTWVLRHEKMKSLNESNISPLTISLMGMIIHGRQPKMFAHYALTCIWLSEPDFTVTSIAKYLRDLENYIGDMSGHLGISLEDDVHPLFHKVLDQEPFKAQTLRSNLFHDYYGPHYVAWRVQGSTPCGDSIVLAQADQFFDLTASKGSAATPRGDSRVLFESDCFFGSTVGRASVVTPRSDSMVASEDDHLVGSIVARARGAMPRGDSSTPTEGNRAGENVSARL